MYLLKGQDTVMNHDQIQIIVWSKIGKKKSYKKTGSIFVSFSKEKCLKYWANYFLFFFFKERKLHLIAYNLTI